MGIFDKLFGNKNEDDKLVILTVLGELVSQSDGNMDKTELDWISEYISSQENMTETRFNTIMKRAREEGLSILNKIQKMNEDDKLEILNFMVGVAESDGYFHGSEAMSIAGFSTFLGFDAIKILEDIQSKFDIDEDELEAAAENMKNYMKNNNIGS